VQQSSKREVCIGPWFLEDLFSFAGSYVHRRAEPVVASVICLCTHVIRSCKLACQHALLSATILQK
jgi:hypothetical protein